ncbi:helix-turn-helix transcriptional regulator [Vibrio lentus]|uniref:Transcriptional regulator n=1 Tax=Vibrio lentus TaxID=136468 RepID=A0A855IS26_9VIBR|nr:AlpA family transcriptional regulator [Vibrio lentus]PMM58957.1 transcriptional regulator [Vibrio lentus]
MKFMRLPEVKEKTGLSKSAIYSKIKEGEFPVSVPIGSRTVAWLESDINEWLEWRVQVRDRAVKGFFS